MERINPLKKNTLALEMAIKKAFDIAEITGFNFYKIFAPQNSLDEKIKNFSQVNKDEEQKFPFILIRPVKSVQKTKGGDSTAITDFLIRIGYEDSDNENGFYRTADIVNYIISFFTEFPAAVKERDGYSYSINLESIESYLNEDLTGGDYWVYDIYMSLYIPVTPHTTFIKENVFSILKEREEKWEK